jgi:hypothetical protein
MPIEVRLSDPLLVDELIRAFSKHGCRADRLGDDSCRVVDVQGNAPDGARHELAFFVRAWQLAHPGVSAVVTSPA